MADHALQASTPTSSSRSPLYSFNHFPTLSSTFPPPIQRTHSGGSARVSSTFLLRTAAVSYRPTKAFG